MRFTMSELAQQNTADSTTDKNASLKSRLGLAALIVYVCLLALGTIGEIWEIEWILDLPLFRPPGKYK
jgi:hypothetical protein